MWNLTSLGEIDIFKLVFFLHKNIENEILYFSLDKKCFSVYNEYDVDFMFLRRCKSGS